MPGNHTDIEKRLWDAADAEFLEAVRQFRYKPDATLPRQVTTSILFRLP